MNECEVTSAGTKVNLCDACAQKRRNRRAMAIKIKPSPRGALCRDCNKSEGDIAFDNYNADQEDQH